LTDAVPQAPDLDPPAGPGGAALARALAERQGGLPVLGAGRPIDLPDPTRHPLEPQQRRRPAAQRYGPAVYFPGNNSNEVETADGNPILFDSGEPYTIALLILWTEDPGNEGIFRSGSANTGNWLWMLSGGSLWGRRPTSTARLRAAAP
jgi:hypothetical protein